jgi:hypothetical protein
MLISISVPLILSDELLHWWEMLGDEKIRELLQARPNASPRWLEASLFFFADYLAEFCFVDFFTLS